MAQLHPQLAAVVLAGLACVETTRAQALHLGLEAADSPGSSSSSDSSSSSGASGTTGAPGSVGLAGFPAVSAHVRLSVKRGRAAYVSKGREGWLHQGEGSLRLGGAGFLQVAAGGQAELSFSGRGTLSARGPAILEWDEPIPGGPLDWTLVEADSLRVDIWSGRPRLHIPGRWVAELQPSSLLLEGEPDGSVRITHDAGDSFLLKIPTPRGVARPPVEVYAGAKIQVGAGSGFRELVRSPALGASHVRWPLGRTDGRPPEGQGDPGTLIAEQVRGWESFPWPWHPDGIPKFPDAVHAGAATEGAEAMDAPSDRWLIGPDGVRALAPGEAIESIGVGTPGGHEGPGPWALGLPEDHQGPWSSQDVSPTSLGLGHGLGLGVPEPGPGSGVDSAEESGEAKPEAPDDGATTGGESLSIQGAESNPPDPGIDAPTVLDRDGNDGGGGLEPGAPVEGAPGPLQGPREESTFNDGSQGGEHDAEITEPSEAPETSETTEAPETTENTEPSETQGRIPGSPFSGPPRLPGTGGAEGSRQPPAEEVTPGWIGPRAPGAASRPPAPIREGLNIGSPRRPRFLPNSSGRRRLEVGPWGLRWSD